MHPPRSACVAAATVAGGTLLSCAQCGGTDDFYQVLEIEDGLQNLGTFALNVTSGGRMNLEGHSAGARDFAPDPGVQPAVTIILYRGRARRADPTPPGLTDCSAP